MTFDSSTNSRGASIDPKDQGHQLEVLSAVHQAATTQALLDADCFGDFQINALRSIIVNGFLYWARILGDACEKLRGFCVDGSLLLVAEQPLP